MASTSIQAEQHRQRQSYRPAPALAVDKRGVPLHVNKIDWLHGSMVTNRHERRSALAEARRFGCNPHKPEHTEKCPKHQRPSKAQKAA